MKEIVLCHCELNIYKSVRTEENVSSWVSYDGILCAKKARKAGLEAAGEQIVREIAWCVVRCQVFDDLMEMIVISEE